MVKLREGWSTCREHGGEYAGDLGAIEHIEDAHPELVAMLKRAVVVPMRDDETAQHAIARAQPNRAQRRNMKGRCA